MPAGTKDHVILCQHDSLATALMARLRSLGVPHYVLELDPVQGAHMELDGIPVVVGDVEERATYGAVRADRARMVIANAATPSTPTSPSPSGTSPPTCPSRRWQSTTLPWTSWS